MKKPGLALLAGMILLGGCAQSSHTVSTTTTTDNGQTRTTRQTQTTADDTGSGRTVSLEEVKSKSKAALDVTATFMTQQRNQIESDIVTATGDLSAKITRLRDQADQASGPAKQRLEERIHNLENDKTDLETMKAKLRTSSQSAWQSLKVGWRQLQQNIEAHSQDIPDGQGDGQTNRKS